MANILVVFGTVEGQTEKIAHFITDELRHLENFVEIQSASTAPLEINNYHGILVGAPVHYSGYPSQLRKWVKRHSTSLCMKPSAFFSVCLGILQKDNEKAQSDERKIVRDFFTWSHWQPTSWTILAGALPYSKYGLIKRFIMKRISDKSGGDTDTSQDYEYTNWKEVRQFAKEFNSIVRTSEYFRKVS